MPTVIVIGAGIAGLAAARAVADSLPGVEVIVLEASPRVGGKLLRAEVGGVAVDVGAEAMLARRPEGLELARAAGLDAQVIAPVTTSALLRNRGRVVALPGRTLIGVPTEPAALRTDGVLSEASVARIEAEPSLPPLQPLTRDVSVGELVGNRFGTEVVQRLVDPLLGGVYAGRADEISLVSALPALAQRLAGGGSLLEAARATLQAGLSAAGPAPGPVFGSIAGGLARLPEALAADPRLTVRLGTTARELHRRTQGWDVVTGPVSAPELMHADAVVVATPAAKTAKLLRPVSAAAAQELAAIRSASMVIVTLALDSAGGLPSGSGVLVPAVEQLQVKAMTFSSQKWPLPHGAGAPWLMRASLGRVGDEVTLHRDDDELVATVLADIDTICGARLRPVDVHVQRWGAGLPQYEVGHVERVARVRAALSEHSELALAGAGLDGVGVPACVASGQQAARRVVAALRGAAQ